MVHLATALAARGLLDLQAPASTLGQVIEAVEKATSAFFANLSASGSFDFDVRVVVEDGAVVFDATPVDTGLWFLPALGLEEIPRGWRKKSFDMIREAAARGAGVLSLGEIIDYHLMWAFDGAENDEEARKNVLEMGGDAADIDEDMLPSKLLAAIPEIAQLDSPKPDTAELETAPDDLKKIWADLDVALAASTKKSPAFGWQREKCPPQYSKQFDYDVFEPAYAFVPTRLEDGPWYMIYDQIYQGWMQGDTRWCTSILVARNPAEIEDRFQRFERGAAICKAMKPLVDWWMDHPAVAEEDVSPE